MKLILPQRRGISLLQDFRLVKFNSSALKQNSDEKMSKDNEPSKKKTVFKEAGLFALKTAAISGAVLGGVALAVPAIGFTAGGVAAGSLAAAYQSAFLGGTIASGSAFAVLQSVGAAGLAASTQAGVVGASAVIAGAHTAIKKFKRKNNENTAYNCYYEKDKRVCFCAKDIECDEKDDDGANNSDCKKGKKVCSCATVIDLNKKEDMDTNTCDSDTYKKVCSCTNGMKPEMVSKTALIKQENYCSDHEIHTKCGCDFCVEAIVSKNKILNQDALNDSNSMLYETTPESIEKWKNVELTEDLTITQHILKRNNKL